MAVSDKITNYNCLRERERKSYLVEATNDNLARLALQHQQSGPEPFEIQVKIRKALEKKLDPVQPGSVRPGRERVRIGLHVVGVDDEDRVEEIGGLGGVLESRIVVDPQGLRPFRNHMRDAIIKFEPLFVCVVRAFYKHCCASQGTGI